MTSPQAPARVRAVSTDAGLAQAFALAEDPAVRVVSFDVFDTLLFRRVPDPVDAFELLAERLHRQGKLVGHIEPDAFARLRIAAEARARAERALAGGVEIELADIYALLGRAALFGPAPDLGALAEIEVALEEELLVADLDVALVLAAARENGKVCIAVSDTYFSEAELARLTGHRVAPLDRLFASSAHGVGKGSGLWPKVVEALGVGPREIAHIGDNEDADQRVPRELGIRTALIRRRTPELDEILEREGRHLRRRVAGDHGDFGLTALRARVLMRGHSGMLPSELQPFWTYGAASIGPALTGFADWVNEQCAAAGVTKALCFMREGTLLSGLINTASASLNGALTAEPLWLSRQVLARAAVLTATPDELAALLVRRSPPTVRGLLRTLGLDLAQVPALSARGDESLADVELRDELLGLLASDAVLRTHILAAAAEMRSRVIRLLDRHRVAGEGTVAIVDLGWQATTQALLDKVLYAERVELHTLGLYLVTHAGAIDRQLGGTEVIGYLGQSGEPAREVSAIIRSPEILEQLCMPDHGSQVDLTQELEAVLAPAAAEGPYQAAERHAAQQGIHAFQAEWLRYRLEGPAALPRLGPSAAPLLRAQLARAVVAPTGREARIFGAWLHDENFGSDAAEAVAGGDYLRALRHLDPQTLVELPMQSLYWPHALAALHDEHLARAAELVSLGAVDWEAFGSRLETGDVEIFYDTGWGFTDRQQVSVEGRRNRFGLSFAQVRLTAQGIRALRIDPAAGPCLIRLDWLTLRLSRAGHPDVLEVTFETPAELARLSLHRLQWIAPKVLLTTGEDPQFHVDLRALAGDDVHTVDVLCAMAVLPAGLAATPEAAMARRSSRARLAVRRLELRTKLPITSGYRRARAVGRRLGGG